VHLRAARTPRQSRPDAQNEALISELLELNRMGFTALKIAVEAPIPSDSVKAANQGEARPFQQHAYAITEVLNHVVLPSVALHPERIPEDTQTLPQQVEFRSPIQ
jgi:hypothetical protein